MSSSSLFSAPDLTNLIPDAEREEGVKYVFPVQVLTVYTSYPKFKRSLLSLAPPPLGQAPAHLLLPHYDRSLLTYSSPNMTGHCSLAPPSI